jgi:uncharacterized membrane protein
MRAHAANTGFVKAIGVATRQREIHRQLRYNRVRKASLNGRALMTRRVSPVQAEFARAIVAALIGNWLISMLLHAVAGIDTLYTLATLGLLYSTQSTYHTYRLALDPGYKVPRCRCAGRANDGTETVLRSRASSLAGLPNSLLGAFAYAGVIALHGSGHTTAILPLAGAAALMSIYLGYVMVFKIRATCSTCINLCALNVLILLQVAL